MLQLESFDELFPVHLKNEEVFLQRNKGTEFAPVPISVLGPSNIFFTFLEEQRHHDFITSVFLTMIPGSTFVIAGMLTVNPSFAPGDPIFEKVYDIYKEDWKIRKKKQLLGKVLDASFNRLNELCAEEGITHQLYMSSILHPFGSSLKRFGFVKEEENAHQFYIKDTLANL